jgi:hypothetical protein
MRPTYRNSLSLCVRAAGHITTPRPRLPQAAFAPTLDRMHDRWRPGAASLDTKIA